MGKVRFEAELIEGHKGVTVVLVPFDPEERWSRKPVRLDSRRHGWLVAGSANGIGFDGYIGERWNRFFIIIDSGLREAAKVEVGQAIPCGHNAVECDIELGLKLDSQKEPVKILVIDHAEESSTN